MPGLSDDDIRRVREASDLAVIAGERVVLRQRGRDLWGCCPFHNEKSPSFKIDPTTQLWHCFGCGEGGDVFSFVMKMDDLGFLDAVRELAKRAGIQLTEEPGAAVARGRKARLKEACEKAAEFYHLQLMRTRRPELDEARTYLAARGLGGSVPNEWNLGYAPGRQALVRYLRSQGFSAQELVDANVALQSDRGGGLRDRFFGRIMFPIRDADGATIAFGGRVVGAGEPKYLNSQETPIFHKSEVLFGLDKAKAAMASTGVAVVVEGYTDVIAMHEAGVKNVVATLGTALTIQHIRTISRHAKHRIVYLY
ncbi:MAG: DNA primase, partial [Slackia sp.]|nr:DNA primase [Slackia sp.]